MNVPLILDRRIYIPSAFYTIIKRKNVSADANVLDIRYLKRSRLKGNASSSDIAISSISLASQSILDISLNAISKHQRVTLIIYLEKLRLSIFSPDSNIYLERYKDDSN